MSRRWVIVLIVLGLLLAGAEVGFQLTAQPTARVDVVNQSGEVMQDLVVTYCGTEIPLGDLEAGGTAVCWVTADQPGLVKIGFHQRNNGMSGVEIGEYDLRHDARQGFKLVVIIDKNQVQRYMDDDPRLTLQKLGDRIKTWLGIDLIESRGLFSDWGSP